MATPSQHGTVLSICKRVFFDRPADRQPRSCHFATAYGNVEWWTTIESRNQMKSLAGAALNEPGLAEGDIDTFAKAFETLLTQKLTDPSIFDLAKFRGKKPTGTLFELIAPSIDKPTFAARIYGEFLLACRAEICTWLTIYPLRKIYAATTVQPVGGVRLIASLDDAEWINFGKRFPELSQFLPPFAMFDGHRLSGDFDPSAPGNIGFDTKSVWLVCEHTGTARGAMLAARRDMAAFLAVLFAFASVDKAGIWDKGGAHRDRRCLQVSDTACQSHSYVVTTIGELMPPLLGPFVVDSGLLATVDGWFGKMSAHANAARAKTAGAFLHHAIRADDLERFIHLFVVVDALFGEMHKVEASVLAGIGKVFPGEPTWLARCGELYDLRNAVVHGACSDLEHWKGLADYVKKFESWPSDDAIDMATASLRRYVDIPPPAPETPRSYHWLTRPIAGFFSVISRWFHKL
jgi:hypothetical protein